MSDFTEADFSGADISGSDFTGAEFSGEDEIGTIGPDGVFDDVGEDDEPFDEDDIVAWEDDAEGYDVRAATD